MRSIQPSLFMPQTEWVLPDGLKDLSKYKEIALKTKIAVFSNQFFAKILRLQRCRSMQIL